MGIRTRVAEAHHLGLQHLPVGRLRPLQGSGPALVADSPVAEVGAATKSECESGVVERVVDQGQVWLVHVIDLEQSMIASAI